MEDKGYNPLPTLRSRALRNNATEAERRLWGLLGNRRLVGVRFNRQVPIGPYICDFVARSAKFIVEVDGGQHGEAQAYDNRRSAFLRSRGYRVIRFWNSEVMNNLEGVSAAISNALEAAPPAGAGGEEGRSPEGEGLSLSGATRPPPLASRVDPSRSGGRVK